MGVRMKKLILASIFCLAFAAGLRAQEKPQSQTIPSEKLLVFPSQPVSPSVWGVVQRLDLQRLQPVQPRQIELKGVIAGQSGVCSVPLLEVHVDTVDPGMVFNPGNRAVPIPRAHVPAPACEKK
jgi:hypothetical protein